MARELHRIETDVLVAGGGMSGVCAALAAARNGARVVLLQDRSMLGGNASSEVRMHICGADCHGARKGWRESGIIEELKLENAVRNPARCYPQWDLLLYEKVMSEPRIRLLLDTDCVGVQMDRGGPLPKRPPRTGRMYEYRGQPGRIHAVRAVRELSEDEFLITAHMFVDCTGDGRLGLEAGADFRIGRESKAMHNESLGLDVDDCQTMGSSILLTSRQLDRPVPFIPPPWARKFQPQDLKVGRPISSWEYGFWWAEWGGQLDTIKDHHEKIRHELYAIALGIWDYIKNSGHHPSSANWALDWVGLLPGKRESRRLLGPHILTQNDVQSATPFPDEVAYGGWAIDVHPPSGVDARTEPPFIPHSVPKVYGIPLRSLYSRNVENLLMGGRLVSGTHLGLATTRVMATCSAIGQAIGTAAAYCAEHGLPSPADISAHPDRVAAVQQALLRHDATLLNTRGADPADLARNAKVTASSEAPGRPAELLLDGWTRDVLDQKTGNLITPHAWHSAPGALPQWIELEWPTPVTLREIHLTFDTGFLRTLTLSPSGNPSVWGTWGVQPETARHYRVDADDETIAEETANYQRKRVHKLAAPISCRRLRIVVSSTNGVPEARVFEARVY